MSDIVIASAVRTPIGAFNGAFAGLSAHQLGTVAVEAASGSAVDGNAALLKDAVRNLVENAARHGGDGVAITLRSGPGARVEVADDGPGPDAMDRAEESLGYKREDARVLVEIEEVGDGFVIEIEETVAGHGTERYVGDWHG